MDNNAIVNYVEPLWDHSVIPHLMDYVRIPNKSPAFDKQWREHGYMNQVVAHFEQWATKQPIRGLHFEVVKLEERTPLILIDIPGDNSDCVLLYGHLDKQPEMTAWRDGLGPWNPVLEDDKLFGRGAADDGYAMFACLSAIGALHAQGIPHARLVVLIEACEESGSGDLPHYIKHLEARIGQPSLVIALDSGCGNYDQLWCTTSLRGLAGGTLTVEILTEGVHSGDAGGVVPCSFRVARQLLSRLEDQFTGRVLPDEFHVKIPDARHRQAEAAAQILGDAMYKKFPFAGEAGPVTTDLTELILNRTWRPALSIIGADGIPALADAGNVLRPMTALRLSLRLPPTCDPKVASQKLKDLMTEDAPNGAKIKFEGNWGAAGWDAPELAPWLERSLDEASHAYFGKPAAYMGEGGTIPFMAMLGERFPQAQFMITGVLGPHSNAHGPNEFLHIPVAKKISCAVAKVLADHHTRTR